MPPREVCSAIWELCSPQSGVKLSFSSRVEDGKHSAEVSQFQEELTEARSQLQLLQKQLDEQLSKQPAENQEVKHQYCSFTASLLERRSRGIVSDVTFDIIFFWVGNDLMGESRLLNRAPIGWNTFNLKLLYLEIMAGVGEWMGSTEGKLNLFGKLIESKWILKRLIWSWEQNNWRIYLEWEFAGLPPAAF